MKEVIYTGKRPYPFTLKVDYYESEIIFMSAKKGARLPDMVADKLVKEGPKAFMIGKTQMEVIPPTVDTADTIDEIDVDDVPHETSEGIKSIEEMNALELKAYAKELPLKGYTKYNTEELRAELIKDRDANKKEPAEIIEGSELNAH